MASSTIALAVGTPVIGSGGDEVVTSVVFEISSASSLSCVPRIKVDGNNTTPTNAQYINLATGAVSAAGTAITANGIYGVYAPGCLVDLNVTAGTASCRAQTVYGRVF